jgi:hypothetical protein
MSSTILFRHPKQYRNDKNHLAVILSASEGSVFLKPTPLLDWFVTKSKSRFFGLASE